MTAALRRRRLLLGAAALPLAGCLPAPYGTYFRPSSTAPFEVRREACGGQAGPPTRLSMQLPSGIAIEASAQRDHVLGDASGIPLRLRLTLPRQRRVRFLGDRPTLQEQRSGRELALPVSVELLGVATVDVGDRVDVAVLHPAGGPLPGAAAPYGSATLRLDGPLGEAPLQMEVQLPALWLGDERLVLPPVTLQRPPSPDFTTYRSAALQQQVQARADACRRDTPQRDCAAILRHAELSFDERIGTARWLGEWRYTTVRNARPLLGMLRLEPGDARPWRLDRDAVVGLHDLASGQRHVVPLGSVGSVGSVGRIDVAYRGPLPLSTPLHARPAPAGADTHIDIGARLPGDVPSFEVRLPPVQVDGETVALPAIQFERRSFDGAFQPFNC
ncbi:hypothetical protein ACPOLB_02145 [Rubrivivax sp. RP6-9]|uniref:hypothetical protein n=1 Tax=Rubrivivax sp. RP6-9 TaxID=3415750 RepID=UPI003CC53905